MGQILTKIEAKASESNSKRENFRCYGIIYNLSNFIVTDKIKTDIITDPTNINDYNSSKRNLCYDFLSFCYSDQTVREIPNKLLHVHSYIIQNEHISVSMIIMSLRF